LDADVPLEADLAQGAQDGGHVQRAAAEDDVLARLVVVVLEVQAEVAGAHRADLLGRGGAAVERRLRAADQGGGVPASAEAGGGGRSTSGAGCGPPARAGGWRWRCRTRAPAGRGCRSCPGWGRR